MVVWCVLCGLTLLSVALVEEGWHRNIASILVVLIAAAKSRLILLHYRECAGFAQSLWETDTAHREAQFIVKSDCLP